MRHNDMLGIYVIKISQTSKVNNNGQPSLIYSDTFTFITETHVNKRMPNGGDAPPIVSLIHIIMPK